MRKINLKLITVLVLLSVPGFAQFKTLELKPIQKHGWNYYYDFRKVSTADALQIPLLAMEDERINKYFNTYSSLQLVSGLVFAIPVLYAVYNITSSVYDEDTFWVLTAGAIGVSLAVEIWSHNRMKLAIDRYNMLLLPHPSGRRPAASPALSIGFSIN
jgi:hypothetical protein